ncbi:MAG: hypothetical protein RMM58_14065 [Chloroflexota bacterium]|nr:hypothetical protein [Chloroflexota bacterium]
MVLAVNRPDCSLPQSATMPEEFNGVLAASLDWPELQRYRYFLWFAPGPAVERAHEEAFARFTAEERETVHRVLCRRLSPIDQWDPALEKTDERTLAFLATRVELRRPGEVERALRRRLPGAPDLLAKLVNGVIASSAGRAFFQEASERMIPS